MHALDCDFIKQNYLVWVQVLIYKYLIPLTLPDKIIKSKNLSSLRWSVQSSNKRVLKALPLFIKTCKTDAKTHNRFWSEVKNAGSIKTKELKEKLNFMRLRVFFL